MIPPVLDLLNTAYRLRRRARRRARTRSRRRRPALISSLATGVLGGDLNWKMIGYRRRWSASARSSSTSCCARRSKLRLPPLAVGIGIYLPMALTLPIVIGAVIGQLYDRCAERARNPEFAKRMGVLLATGFIVGDSLFERRLRRRRRGDRAAARRSPSSASDFAGLARSLGRRLIVFAAHGRLALPPHARRACRSSPAAPPASGVISGSRSLRAPRTRSRIEAMARSAGARDCGVMWRSA